MIDTILTILGVLVFLPWIVRTISTKWQKGLWHRQLLIATLAFELITTLYIPSVMYVGLGVLLVSLGIYLIKERPKVEFTPLFIIAILYLIWYAISLLWSAAPNKGSQFLLDNGLVLVAFSAIPCFIYLKKDELILILQQFCYAACVFVALSLLSWIVSAMEINLPLWEWPILQKSLVGNAYCYSWVFRFLGGVDGYIHPSYNLLPIFIATPIAIWLKQRSNSQSMLWLFLWTGGLVLTLVSQSRMGIIYSTIILISNFIYLLPSRRSKIIATIFCGAISSIILVLSMNFLQNYGEDDTRNRLQSYTIRYIKAKPLTGAGAGALNPVEICHTINETYWPNVGYVDPNMQVAEWKPKTRMLPHNQWLADWAHAGVFAALITLAIYICIAWHSYITKNYWGFIFILIFTIFSFLEPPLYIGKGFYLFCLMSVLVFLTHEKR